MGIYTAQSGFFPSTVVGPNGRLQCGYDTLNGVGARPLFAKWAQRDPQNRAQFFTGDAINNSSNYLSIPKLTSNILGVRTVETIPGNLARNTNTGPR